MGTPMRKDSVSAKKKKALSPFLKSYSRGVSGAPPEEGAPGYLPPKLRRMVHEFASFKMASVPGRSWHGVYASDTSTTTLATQRTLRHTAPYCATHVTYLRLRLMEG